MCRLVVGRLMSGNGYALYITSTGNAFVARWVIALTTIPLLDFVMIGNSVKSIEEKLDYFY